MHTGVSVSLPNNWTPRHYQLPVFEYFKNGGSKAFLLWHRRAGKDDFALHFTACQAMQCVGNYWHMLPQYGQCRKAIWDAVNKHTGKRRIDEAFPDELCTNKRAQDMFISFVNGSTWQLVGSDNYDALVGAPPAGIVLSEYALADPAAWDMFRPILAENDGWVIMITTPRGKNHAYSQYLIAKESPEWFASCVTADQSGVFSKEKLEEELQGYISNHGEDEGRAKFRQEYYCDFEGPQEGAFFYSQIADAEMEGRFTVVPYNANYPVYTGWDIGVNDPMAIVFAQKIGLATHVIDYFETSGGSLQEAVAVLQKKPYTYAAHCMPHDISVRVWNDSAKTRYQTALELGVRPIITVPRVKALGDRIHIIRTAFPQLYIDNKKCAVLLDRLRNYKRKRNKVMNEWSELPEDNGAQHGVDALGCFLTGVKPVEPVRTVEDIMSGIDYGGAW